MLASALRATPNNHFTLGILSSCDRARVGVWPARLQAGIHCTGVGYVITFALDPAIALATAPLSLLMSTIDTHRIWGGAGGVGPGAHIACLLGEFTTCGTLGPTLVYYRPSLSPGRSWGRAKGWAGSSRC